MNLPVLSSDRLVTLQPSGAALSHGKLKNNNCNILYLNTRHFIILYNRQLVLSVFHFHLIYIFVWLLGYPCACERCYISYSGLRALPPSIVVLTCAGKRLLRCIVSPGRINHLLPQTPRRQLNLTFSGPRWNFRQWR